MSDFTDLKDWFFLQDAAKHLSDHFNKEFSVNELFQATLEGHLFISWYVMGKPALPAKVELPAHQAPEQPIPNTDQAELLSGAYKIELGDIEINKIGGFNFRHEWLMNLARDKDPITGSFSTSGFFIEDDEGNLWRPLEYRARNKGILASSTEDESENLIEVTSPEGYYPKISLPDEQELIIRKTDLNNYIKKSSSLDNGQSKLLNTDANPLSPFHAMDRLGFKEITIRVDPDNLVLRLSARDSKCTVSFAAIGLTKKNEVTLNKQGDIFMALANGRFSPEMRGATRAITNLSKLLRDAFKIEDSPFLKNMPQFKLSIPKDNEAKRKALKRTVTYDDNIGGNLNASSDDFLQKNDPNYDPNNPMYSMDDET